MNVEEVHTVTQSQNFQVPNFLAFSSTSPDLFSKFSSY